MPIHMNIMTRLDYNTIRDSESEHKYTSEFEMTKAMDILSKNLVFVPEKRKCKTPPQATSKLLQPHTPPSKLTSGKVSS